MAEDTKTTLLTIYNRVAPKIQIPPFIVTVENAPDSYPSLEIKTHDERLYVCLVLHSKTEDMNSHRWEYMDCITGSIIESELDYTATAEEVIAFFKHTLETDDSVMKL